MKLLSSDKISRCKRSDAKEFFFQPFIKRDPFMGSLLFHIGIYSCNFLIQNVFTFTCLKTCKYINTHM